MIAFGEYFIGFVLLSLSGLSILSKLWHSESGYFLRTIGTAGIIIGLLMFSFITLDVKAENPWSRLPHAWERIMVWSGPRQGKDIGVTETKPLITPPKPTEPLQLIDLYNEKPQGVSLDMTDVFFKPHGGYPHIHLKASVLIDSPVQIYTIRFYIPHGQYTYRICMTLANKNTGAYRGIFEALKSHDSKLDPSYPFPDNFLTIRHPKFSGKVVIYAEDPLNLSEKVEIDSAFRQNGMAVEIRGMEYVLMRNMMRDAASTTPPS